jgi:hypothetical protein
MTTVRIGTAIYCDSGTIDDVARDAVAWRKHIAGSMFVVFNDHAIEVFPDTTALEIVGKYMRRTDPIVRSVTS